ncbi:Putative polyketide synthase [Beggiatoa sp. SS]|nr:Putative polyketide synthase [Beggiatoa sp. SS]
MMIISLTRKLESDFGTLSKTLFFEYKSLAELGQYFIQNHREQLIEKISDAVVVSAVATETKTVAVLPELEQNHLARFTFPSL